MASQQKILLIFDLMNVLCKRPERAFSTLGLANPGKALLIRNHIEDLCRFLFVRNKLYIKTAIWTSGSAEETD